METKFHQAMAIIRSGNLDEFRKLLAQDPTLATDRSAISHPTLLQCLVLDFVDLPNKLEMTEALIDAGAEINGPMMAAASINNVECAALLLDNGAAINGTGGWSPLEEALYWGNQETIDLLRARGASVHNLRLAAGLGRLDLIEGFFNGDGSLRAEAGKIAWPFAEPEKSNLPGQIKNELLAKISQWTDERRDIVNNAFIYACMRNQAGAANLLLEKGAEINTIPQGFDYAGTGLHYAAIRGHRAMVEFLVAHGANVSVRDTKVRDTPAGWAEHGGHLEIKNYLDQVAKS